MELQHKALFLLVSLNSISCHPPPISHPPCPNPTYCPDPLKRAVNNTVINTITSIATSFATSIETRFITIVTTTTANNTVFSTVTETSFEPSPAPLLNSNPFFFNPNLIWLKYCTGPAAPDNVGCTGGCTIYAQECNSSDQTWHPREVLEGCQVKAHNTECIETNGKVIFRTCSLDVWGQRSDPATGITCTSVCEFNPGVTEDGRWIYNTRWTQHIDVYPNPGRVWAKDFNGGRC
jgi:hypothetical protein